MTFRHAIDLFIGEMRSQGRMTSGGSERAYRDTLQWHADDVSNRDPAYTNRDDVKRTLRRWENPNTQANRRAILVSFYDWAMEEGHRKDNPARQTRRPRKKPAQVYRLTLDETRRLLAAAHTKRERRVIFLGVCAGLRNAELRGLQGRHFDRPGWIWVSKDIAKGGRERWVPALPDIAAVVDEIRQHTRPTEFVIPAQKVYNLEPNRDPVDLDRKCSAQALWRLVERVGRKAGIAAHIHPHLMRHCYGDFIARYAGMRNAQFLLGHADIATTETYTGAPTLDELAASIEGFTFIPETGPDTNTGSRSGASTDLSERYRHGDLNPGSHPPPSLSGVLRDLFGNPAIREAAQELGAPR